MVPRVRSFSALGVAHGRPKQAPVSLPPLWGLSPRLSLTGVQPFPPLVSLVAYQLGCLMKLRLHIILRLWRSSSLSTAITRLGPVHYVMNW